MRFGLAELILSAVAGGSIGFLSGMFGVGGGFLLVPILNIVIGVPMPFAVGAGACQVLGPATTSLLARHAQLHNFRLPLTIAGGLFVGVLAGASLLRQAKQRGTASLGGNELPIAEVLVLVVYLVLLLGVGIFATWEGRRRRAGRPIRGGWMARLRIPPYAGFAEFEQPTISVSVLAWFGLGVGFLAGLLGMSGGLILLPGLVYLLGMQTQRAVVSSLVIVWIVGLQSTIAHGWYGNIDLALVATLLVGGTVGARLGSDVGQRLRGHQLRESFGWLLIATSAMIAARLGYLLLYGAV